jgi:hypothetical protein
VIFESIMEVRVLPVTSATTVETVEADIQTGRIILGTQSASASQPSEEAIMKQKHRDRASVYKTYYRVEALCTVLSVD